MKNRFYLACFRDNVGSNVAFQCHGYRGYHTDIAKAHVLTLAEAQYHYNHARIYDQPISADHVDALTTWKVDHQHIPSRSEIVPFCSTYAAYEESRYDGNDVFWLNNKTCTTSPDFSKASCLNTVEAESLGDSYVVIPFSLAEGAKRKTFEFGLFNPRTMVQGAGLKTPDHIKKAKRKTGGEKSRWNCPCCGRISWQLNPYDYDGCRNFGCSEWSAYA